jgi:hypothetical protein
MPLWTVWDGGLLGADIDSGAVTIARCAWTGGAATPESDDPEFAALSPQELGAPAEELVALEVVIDVSVGHDVPYLLVRTAAAASRDRRFVFIALADAAGWAPRVALSFSVHDDQSIKEPHDRSLAELSWNAARVFDGPGAPPAPPQTCQHGPLLPSRFRA